MANLIRTAKASGAWTTEDLDSYNITLLPQNAATFFGTQHLPQSSVNSEILNVQTASDMTISDNQQLVDLLYDAMIPTPASENSAVTDFMVELFHTLHYAFGHHLGQTYRDFRLLICGKWKQAKINVCLLDCCPFHTIMLLVQEDKHFRDAGKTKTSAEAQLIAKAVAAFSWNNRQRQESGQPLLESKIIPGIVMKGTLPIFFKIPVTQQLATAIMHGQYPAEPTIVAVHFPDLPRPNLSWSEGMVPLDNRHHILNCFEAFKAIIGI